MVLTKLIILEAHNRKKIILATVKHRRNRMRQTFVISSVKSASLPFSVINGHTCAGAQCISKMPPDINKTYPLSRLP